MSFKSAKDFIKFVESNGYGKAWEPEGSKLDNNLTIHGESARILPLNIVQNYLLKSEYKIPEGWNTTRSVVDESVSYTTRAKHWKYQVPDLAVEIFHEDDTGETGKNPIKYTVIFYR